VVDNLSGKAPISSCMADPARAGGPSRCAARAPALKELRVASCASPPALFPPHAPQASLAAPRSNIGRAAPSHDAVARCKQYITDGDMMQVADLAAHRAALSRTRPVNLYRSLRSINPVAVHVLFSISATASWWARRPRSWCAARGDKVDAAAPIPRARGKARLDAGEGTWRWRRELVADPKERARAPDADRPRPANDVGRIARIGSVKVTETMVVERYSHVMHMVSNVEGDVARRSSPAMELLRATFFPRARSRARRRSVPWRSSTSSSRRSAACTREPRAYLGFNGNIDSRQIRDPAPAW